MIRTVAGWTAVLSLFWTAYSDIDPWTQTDWPMYTLMVSTHLWAILKASHVGSLIGGALRPREQRPPA